MAVTLGYDRKALYQPEELIAILGADTEAKLEALARRTGHQVITLAEKRVDLIAQRQARANCPAFLADDGLPFAARMLLIHKGVS